MLKLNLFAIMVLLTSGALVGAPMDCKVPSGLTSNTFRRDAANAIFVFLRDHALRDEFDPYQYADEGAYELHCAAKRAQSTMRGKTLPIVKSDWNRGGYYPDQGADGIVTEEQYEELLIKIRLIQMNDMN